MIKWKRPAWSSLVPLASLRAEHRKIVIFWTVTNSSTAHWKWCYIRIIVNIIFKIDWYFCSTRLKIFRSFKATTLLFMQLLHLDFILLMRWWSKHSANCFHKIVKHAFLLIIFIITALLRCLSIRNLVCAFSWTKFSNRQGWHYFFGMSKLWAWLSDKVLNIGWQWKTANLPLFVFVT